ncbi:hypothetical protein [Bdellovibrio sp. GT3]|uniref:hypothetical protein n=1 Tax=Bdellovibrio sp. GT3 TaxID=3136282 RepID=UPI0030F2527C
MPSKKKVALLIDGKSERAILEKLDRTAHDFSPIKRDRNGKDVSAKAIANECIEILGFSSKLHQSNIIIVDREDRTTSALTLETEIRNLIAENFKGTFDLVVSDKMFENWILADIENVSSKNPTLLNPTPNSKEYEGTHGAGQIESIWKTTHSKRFGSDKAGNCKKLFKHVRPLIGSTYSHSLHRFLQILQKHEIKIY